MAQSKDTALIQRNTFWYESEVLERTDRKEKACPVFAFQSEGSLLSPNPLLRLRSEEREKTLRADSAVAENGDDGPPEPSEEKTLEFRVTTGASLS